MSGYSSRYAQRNSSAARDWAADRQAKILRAKQLREQRKRGTPNEDCTFQPQKFNDYEPAVGSSRLAGGISEYSQDYLKNFHFNAQEDSHRSSQSNHQQSYQRDDQPSSIPPYQYQYQQQQHQQQHQHQQHQHNHPNRYYDQDPSYYQQREEDTESQPLYSLSRKSSLTSISSKSSTDSFGLNHVKPTRYTTASGQYENNAHANTYSDGYYHTEAKYQGNNNEFEALANQMQRHATISSPYASQQQQQQQQNNADEHDACDMSFEFAASASSVKRMNNISAQSNIPRQNRQRGVSNTQMMKKAEPHDNSSPTTNSRNQTSAPSSSQYSKNARKRSIEKRTTSARARVSEQNEVKTDATTTTTTTTTAASSPSSFQKKESSGPITCTRQSGCQCSQCNADLVFQNQLRGSSGAANTTRNGSGRKKESVRPPWNSDIDPSPTTTDQEEEYAAPVQKSSRPKRAPKPKRAAVIQNRPKWQDITSTDDLDKLDMNSNGNIDQKARVDRMRDELRGGKNDFIEQVHGQKHDTRSGFGNSYSSYNQDSSTRNTFSNPRERETETEMPRARPSNRRHQVHETMNESSSAAKAPYRGMYIPDSNEEALPRQSSSSSSSSSASARNGNMQRQQASIPQGQQNPNFQNNIDDLPVNAVPNAVSDIPEYAAPVTLVPCSSCGRKFKEETLVKHSKVCKKVFQTKRQKFDTTKARLKDVLQNPEDGRVVKSALRKKSETKRKSSDKAGKWKKQSAALREAMRYNKMLAKAEKEGKDIASLPPPPAEENDDLVPCPHCGRTFNDKAAERHIPRCKDTKAKPKRLVRKSSTYGAVKRR